MIETEIEDLVRDAQSGNEEAFSRLVSENERVVFAIVLRRLKNRTEANEVTQDVFIQMFRKLSQLREPERFHGWLRRIAVRLAINRAIRRPREVLGETAAMNAVGEPRDNPLDKILSYENAGHVRDGIDQLGDLDRKTLIAFYFEGQSIEQMSNTFASPIGTIKRRLHTARNRLRDRLVKLQAVS